MLGQNLFPVYRYVSSANRIKGSRCEDKLNSVVSSFTLKKQTNKKKKQRKTWEGKDVLINENF